VDQRLSLVTLGVADLPRARAFYAALGWREGLGSQDEVAFFQLGGVVLGLWDRVALARDSGLDEPPAPGAVALAYNVASPGEVDAILVEARAAGARVVREGAPTDWGGYSALFRDPDGHPWEVAHNPFWRVEADGSTRLGR
jgi:catechol 2,3-dioxygenase-like lactoylglutathione lyase family enzyme